MEEMVNGGYCLVSQQEQGAREDSWPCDDIFVIGSPCPIFSMLNKNRFDQAHLDSMMEHADFKVISSFMDVLRLQRPRCALYENVAGILRQAPRSAGSDATASPMDLILELAKREAPAYKIRYFTLCASRWGPLPRERMYAVFMREDAGGTAKLDEVADWLDVFLDADSGPRASTLSECMLPADSERLAERLQERLPYFRLLVLGYASFSFLAWGRDVNMHMVLTLTTLTLTLTWNAYTLTYRFVVYLDVNR